MNGNKFTIYQPKDDHGFSAYRFASLERLRAAGMSVKNSNYDHIYTGELSRIIRPDAVELENIYMKFNINLPEDFKGYPLSIGDVVVICRDSNTTAYYVSNTGFEQTPEFLKAPYKYYSIHQPVDISTFPKTQGKPALIENYGRRKTVENGGFTAWGDLIYEKPLTQKQINEYGLKAASSNPDHTGTAPKQLEAQIAAIAKWEENHRIPAHIRLTRYDPELNIYVKNDFATHEQMSENFWNIIKARSRETEPKTIKRPIAEQLRENALLAVRENTMRDTPIKTNEREAYHYEH